jgi:hypothetical protein
MRVRRRRRSGYAPRCRRHAPPARSLRPLQRAGKILAADVLVHHRLEHLPEARDRLGAGGAVGARIRARCASDSFAFQRLAGLGQVEVRSRRSLRPTRLSTSPSSISVRSTRFSDCLVTPRMASRLFTVVPGMRLMKCSAR